MKQPHFASNEATPAQKIAQNRAIIVTAMQALQKISREELDARNAPLLDGITHLGKACNRLEIAFLTELDQEKRRSHA